MPGSSFGEMFRVSTFGESHGPALGCVVDGCPPGLALSEADLQVDLDRRKPGTSKYATQRREDDQQSVEREGGLVGRAQLRGKGGASGA